MKKFTIIKLLFAVALPALAAAGCHKTEWKTMYYIEPMEQQEDKGDFSPIAGSVTGYVFYGDTSRYVLGTYEEALRGILKTSDGAEVQAAMSMALGEDGLLGVGPIDKENIVLLVCHTDPRYKFYAWRNARTAEGIDRIKVSVYFQLWQTKGYYIYGGWRMKYDNHPSVPPKE